MKGIKIAYDAKRAFANFTGLGNYSRTVIGTMAALYPDNHYLLMTPRERENPRMDAILMRENVETVTPASTFDKWFPSLWRSATMVESLSNCGADIYHGLSNEIPLLKMSCPSVVTIHDLIWRKVPQDYSAIDRRLYEFKYRNSAKQATRIIAISECTKRDIVNDWNIDPAKIDVIYQGCDAIFSKAVTLDDRQRVRSKYNLPQRYIIAVGTIQSRKNQLLAIKALEGLPKDVSLIVVGSADEKYQQEIDREITARRLDNRVRQLRNVPFDDLPALYHCAEFSSYTSRYEGFGIPIIESLSVSTPVIGCTGSCLEEAGGPGGLFVAPDDVDGYVTAARKILDERSFRDQLASKGSRYVKRFNPTDFATSIMKTYNKAILDKTLNDIK